jgi:heavy metal sensor kinase
VTLGLQGRLTIGYTVLFTAIIAALGAVLVVRLEADLEASLDRELEKGSAHITRGWQAGRADFRELSRTALPSRGSAAQLLHPSGRVLMTYGMGAGAVPLARKRDLEAALEGERRIYEVVAGHERESLRAMASPVERSGRLRVLVVARSFPNVEDSIARLLWPLLLAAPVALLASVACGWWVARRAVRSVERIASETEEIGIDRLHARIAVPPRADEIGDLAVTLNAMLDRLEKGVWAKQRLIADASHQVRTPLAVMRTELDVSLRGDDLTSGARAVLESTREEVDRLSRTVDNLLTLAQADEGRLELLKTRVGLDEAMESATRPLLGLAAAKRVRLLLAGAEGCETKADPQALHEALTNLVENAIKFSPPEGEVRVTAWSGGDEIGVTVTDEGPGVPAHARTRIFDRFYRVGAGGRDAGGSGLGLAICREIAVAHGGRVWVDSEEGRATSFSLALPRSPELKGADDSERGLARTLIRPLG